MTKKKKIIVSVSVIAAVLLPFLCWLIVELAPFHGAVSQEYWVPEAEFCEADTVVLEKTAGKDFKILNLNDIQLNDALDSFGGEKQAFRTIDELITKETPDLITVGGDMVWASPFTRHSIRKLIKKLDSYRIPWAPVFGNHDDNGNADLNWFADRLEESEYCLFRKGPNNIGGVGNYIINIKENGKIIQTLFMLDSHSSRYYPELDKTEYDFLYYGQLGWYEWGVKGVEKLAGAPVNSMVFLHIPPVQFKTAYEEWKADGAKPEFGFGENRENVCCAPVDSGFFALAESLGSTKHIVAAHDHVNNASVMYRGIRLTYGMKTGNRCYADDDMNGGTVFTLNGAGEVSLWHVYVAA